MMQVIEPGDCIHQWDGVEEVKTPTSYQRHTTCSKCGLRHLTYCGQMWWEIEGREAWTRAWQKNAPAD